MRLVHNELAHGTFRRRHAFPIEIIRVRKFLRYRTRVLRPAILLSVRLFTRFPVPRSTHRRLGVRIEQNFALVKPVPSLRIVRTIDSVTVQQFFDAIRQRDVPNAPRLVHSVVQLELSGYLACGQRLGRKEHQTHRRRRRRVHGKVHRIFLITRNSRRAERPRGPFPRLPAHLWNRLERNGWRSNDDDGPFQSRSIPRLGPHRRRRRDARLPRSTNALTPHDDDDPRRLTPVSRRRLVEPFRPTEETEIPPISSSFVHATDDARPGRSTRKAPTHHHRRLRRRRSTTDTARRDALTPFHE